MTEGQPISLLKSHYPLVILSWKVVEGDFVSKDQDLGNYQYESKDGTMTQSIRSNFEGKISGLKESGTLCEQDSNILGYINEPCSHAVQLHGLCALCGRDLTIADYTGSSDMSRATINMTHDSRGVKISQSEATRIELTHVARLLQVKKLSLLLDLDQTVVHATVDKTVCDWLAAPDNPAYPTLTEVYSFTLDDSPAVYHIKLRPGARDFLEQMHDKFEMHIYTMGTRNYAFAVAAILDPDRKYFMDRILSRDDSGSFMHKSIQRLFPVDQSMVVAIDDRADVWHWSPNLIKVRPYNFFLGIGDINEPMKDDTESEDTSRASLPNSKPNIKPVMVDDDVDLKYVKRTMTSLHATFYDRKENGSKDVDVCKILPWMKNQVLAGVQIAFSGVIPIGYDPTKQDLWIHATQFGAICHLEMNSSVTHLIARKAGTAKVNEAKDMACWIVKPEWLMDCIVQWNRVSESKYYVDESLNRPEMLVTDTNWEDLDKEIDEFLDESSNGEEESQTPSALEQEEPTETAASDDDNSWLDSAIDAELDNGPEEVYIPSKARKRTHEEI